MHGFFWADILAGVDLASACDIRYCSEDAKLWALGSCGVCSCANSWPAIDVFDHRLCKQILQSYVCWQGIKSVAPVALSTEERLVFYSWDAKQLDGVLYRTSGCNSVVTCCNNKRTQSGFILKLTTGPISQTGHMVFYRGGQCRPRCRRRASSVCCMWH